MNGIYKYTEFCKTVINLEVSVFITLGQSHVTSFIFIMSYIVNKSTQLMLSVLNCDMVYYLSLQTTNIVTNYKSVNMIILAYQLNK